MARASFRFGALPPEMRNSTPPSRGKIRIGTIQASFMAGLYRLLMM